MCVHTHTQSHTHTLTLSLSHTHTHTHTHRTQDVIQFEPLLRTMAKQMVNKPGMVPQLLMHVGPGKGASEDFNESLTLLNCLLLTALFNGPQCFIQVLFVQCCTHHCLLLHPPTHPPTGPLLDWMVHVANLGVFSALHTVSGPLKALTAAAPSDSKLLTPKQRFAVNRLLEAVKFGAGKDFTL